MISGRTRFLFRALFSLGLLLLLGSKVDWKALAATLLGMNLPQAGLVSLLTPVLILLMALRWNLFLRMRNFRQPFGRVVGLTWAGQFFNSVLPGSIGGDLIRIHRLCVWVPDRKAAAAASVVVDRFSALLALGVLALTVAVFDGLPWPVRQYLPETPSWVWVAGVGAFAALAVYIAVIGSGEFRWKAAIRSFFSELRFCLGRRGAVGLAIGISFAVHLTSFTIVFGLASALGIAVGFVQVVSMLPIVMICLLLPVTVNGHGLRELLIMSYLSSWNIPFSGAGPADAASMAFSLSMLAVANDMLWSLPGGIWYLFNRS